MAIKRTLQNLLLAVGAVPTALGLASCTTERPYQFIELSEIKNSNERRVAVEGLPSVVTRKGFVLSKGDYQIQVTVRTHPNLFYFGDYDKSVREALEREATDSDEQPVRVYGISTGDNIVNGIFVEVEGSLFSLYR